MLIVRNFDDIIEHRCIDDNETVGDALLTTSTLTRSVCIGEYADVQGKMYCFYKWNSELTLQIDRGAPIRLTGANCLRFVVNDYVAFRMTHERQNLINIEYPIPDDIKRIDSDLTAFVEEEHFDLFLMIRNILADRERLARIWNH